MAAMARIFDAHFHVIDPAFPLVANQGFLPPTFTTEDYLAQARPLGVVGGALVSGSFQAFDQGYLVAALKRLGPGFVGVTQLPEDTPDSEIERLKEAGVSALRFNLKRGGSAGIESLERFAARVHDLAGWHLELYAPAEAILALESRLAALPQLVVDHLGMESAALPALRRLVAGGAKVKATGFGRVELDVAATLRALAEVDPTALLFGTDLPSTRARRPFAPADLELTIETLGEETARLALYENAMALYRPEPWSIG